MFESVKPRVQIWDWQSPSIKGRWSLQTWDWRSPRRAVGTNMGLAVSRQGRVTTLGLASPGHGGNLWFYVRIATCILSKIELYTPKRTEGCSLRSCPRTDPEMPIPCCIKHGPAWRLPIPCLYPRPYVVSDRQSHVCKDQRPNTWWLPIPYLYPWLHRLGHTHYYTLPYFFLS